MAVLGGFAVMLYACSASHGLCVVAASPTGQTCVRFVGNAVQLAII